MLTETQLAHSIRHYYEQLLRIQVELNKAALRRAQIRYTAGALIGLMIFTAVACIIAVVTEYVFDRSVYRHPIAFAFGGAIAGALGASASVSWRATFGNLRFDPAAGIAALPRLGALRPSIGAIFGLATYFALKSGFIRVGQENQNFYFFMFFSFAAGFSERLVPDLVRRAEGIGAGAQPSSDPVSARSVTEGDDGSAPVG